MSRPVIARVVFLTVIALSVGYGNFAATVAARLPDYAKDKPIEIWFQTRPGLASRAP
jgi:hypothetical protein